MFRIFDKGDNFCFFMLAFLFQVFCEKRVYSKRKGFAPTEKRSTLKEKNLLPKGVVLKGKNLLPFGANFFFFFLFIISPAFSERRKNNFDRVLSLVRNGVLSGLNNITKTCLYNFDPLKPHFYKVKLGFTGVYIIFLISAQKHGLWVLVSRGGSNKYPQSMFRAEL